MELSYIFCKIILRNNKNLTNLDYMENKKFSYNLKRYL